MLEIAGPVLDALGHGHRVAIATVTRVLGSAPRTLGTAMAVTDAGAVIGSISGGCVEGAIYDSARDVLETGRGLLTEFGVSDDDAFAVGLSCGGTVDVFLQELAPAGPGAAHPRNAVTPAVLHQLRRAAAGEAAGLALVVDGAGVGRIIPPGATGPEAAGTASAVDAARSGDGLDADAVRRIRAELGARIDSGRTAVGDVACDGTVSRVLYLVAATPPRFLIFGAVDFAAALADAASLLGYRVTVCDARAVFATPARFPTAADVVVEWPSDYLARTPTDSRTVVCVLTHDEKVDLPVLTLALRRGLAYVGAMGSRRTHDRRMLRLREAGLGPAELDRLHSPIGLDLGASSPQETAVSILAEVLAARSGASAAPLRDRPGPIHPHG